MFLKGPAGPAQGGLCHHRPGSCPSSGARRPPCCGSPGCPACPHFPSPPPAQHAARGRVAKPHSLCPPPQRPAMPPTPGPLRSPPRFHRSRAVPSRAVLCRAEPSWIELSPLLAGFRPFPFPSHVSSRWGFPPVMLGRGRAPPWGRLPVGAPHRRLGAGTAAGQPSAGRGYEARGDLGCSHPAGLCHWNRVSKGVSEEIRFAAAWLGNSPEHGLMRCAAA